jgi:hypothetical protein
MVTITSGTRYHTSNKHRTEYFTVDFFLMIHDVEIIMSLVVPMMMVMVYFLF